MFGRLAKARCTVRPSKCLVGSDTVDFLGQEISREVRTSLWDGVSKVRKGQMPNSKRRLRSFLGLTGFYWNQIPNYAAIAVLLTNLLRKGQPNKLSWGEAQVRAYETLKRAVTERPILHLPNDKKQFILRTDASDTGIGAILLQEHGGRPPPIAFASKKLSPRERRFSAIEKGCWAIV